MSDEHNENQGHKLRKTRSSRSRTSLSKKELLSRYENLEVILADKEVFIDNLIDRAGKLESDVLEKDEYAENLSNTLQRHEEHIGNLDKAIQQRDDHVARLEQENSQTVDLLHKNQRAEELIVGLKSEVLSLQANSAQFDAQLEKQNAIIDALLGKQNAKVESMLGKQQSATGHLMAQSESVSQDLRNLKAQLDLVEKNRKKDESEFKTKWGDEVVRRHRALQQEINRLQMKLEAANRQRQTVGELKNEINELNNEIERRDNWGNNVQARLATVAAELSAIKSSSSWFITKPLRLLAESIKFLLAKLLWLILLPYRLLVKLGWWLAPKTFHRIYHSNLVRSLRKTEKMPLVEAPHSTFEIAAATPAPEVSPPVKPIPMEPSINQGPAQKSTQGAWRLGKRLDKPESK
ncbi:MAG: hypothetical protein AAF431_06910 [Pseudomonadota bacterium]